MRVLVAGGGPIGTFTAIALARRGHQVTLVDRDPGPVAEEPWKRRGVMQAEHPHGWRPGVRRALRAEMPDVYADLLAAGAVPRHPPGVPEGFEDHLTGFFLRRSHLERVLRHQAHREPNLVWRTGHVDAVDVRDGVVQGLVVDGRTVAAEVVVVATGRASRLGAELRGEIEGGPCGFGYVCRMYQALDHDDACDLPVPSMVTGPGYLTVVVPQDADTHAVLFSYPTDAPELALLRSKDGFERAAAATPNLARWTDPDRFRPITPVTVGGNLTNTYQLQGAALGLVPAHGLFFIGDQVLTTNPAAGRNISLLLEHAQVLIDALAEPDPDLDGISLGLDEWAERQVRPWYLDHVRWDAGLLGRFRGADLDLDQPIPSDVICAAAEQDPSFRPVVGPYAGMVTGPDALDQLQEPVRALLRDGWRPPVSGPTAAELGRLMGQIAASA